MTASTLSFKFAFLIEIPQQDRETYYEWPVSLGEHTINILVVIVYIGVYRKSEASDSGRPTVHTCIRGLGTVLDSCDCGWTILNYCGVLKSIVHDVG